MRRRNVITGIAWALIYIFLVLAPLFIMLTGPRAAGREFWRDLSVSLGFIGLAMMALQFVLTARFKWLKAPYGSDIVYHFHRQISFVAFALIITHPLLLFIFSPRTLALLNVFIAPWRARFAVVAVLSLIGLIVFSVWRKKLKIDYYSWRIWHGILAILAVGMALVHVELAGYYVNTPWKRALWIVYAVFWIGLLVYTRLVKPLLLMRKKYRVVDLVQERGGAWTLVLEPDGHAGIRFHPGQFAWINLRSSPFSEKEHPFSISSSAAENLRLSFTIKELGDFTRRIKDTPIGETVYVDGPYGAFTTDRHDHARGFIFIAGGVGITPIMSMMRTMADRDEKRPLVLFYANRDWEGITFREELERLKTRLDLTLIHVLEKPPQNWTGKQGYISRKDIEEVIPKGLERNQLEIFLCGPPPMMRAVDRIINEMNIWPGDFHYERFDLV